MKNHVVQSILNKTYKGNLDNISRTRFYFNFYKKHPEIRWAFLASMVSRNAGWNITDLSSKWFQQLISKEHRAILFQTYERANWTIFADAYPQLLWYEYIKKTNHSDITILKNLNVSQFMQKEWLHFLEKRDEERLCIALVINEQFVLQQNVIEQELYRKKVFSTALYWLEEHGHFSYVLFPTTDGRLYGYYIRQFTKVKKRITLGKQLMNLLFHPELRGDFYQFACKVEPTGSRNEYRSHLNWSTANTSPYLRLACPIIHHHWKYKKDWSLQMNGHRFLKNRKIIIPKEMNKWVQRKELELGLVVKASLLIGGY
ncbi:DUF2515 family protein [Alkalihalobacillus hemicellulosilyticus]|uniref:Uncharacterized protein YppC n=1 Tax=Halalkalibacter hemicellulosilyticusJCM 9152 TaxID=1236971 RepID=W4QAJ0_9BACI|nr:DUF2515 family protein [Halalkalibacter hemicellulosilyticus]GAE29066.1 uncharacterized protein YppC [Halalkalibacter hemicellulosilyticusJCM 9152]